MAPMPNSPKFHIAMFPWIAFGHMVPYLHLANELADRGHHIIFFLPKKALSQLQTLVRHPTLISFHPLTIPHVHGLPPGSETASDVPARLHHLLMTAMDQTAEQVEAVLRGSNSDFLFYDSLPLAPALASRLGIKAIFYSAVSAATIAISLVPAREVCKDRRMTDAELVVPPPGYPSSTVVFRPHEARHFQFPHTRRGDGPSVFERVTTSLKQSDAIAIRTCREIDGEFCDYIGTQYGKPVFLTGPTLAEHSPTPLEDRWAQWLGGFNPRSVIFCAFGSQFQLPKDKFQELVLGLEQTGLPFLAALKPPPGAATIEEALPEGFQERVGGRGVVHGGWVQQLSILNHPSVGCFLSHCGYASMWESLVADCQLVLVANLFGDHILNARHLAEELKVAVEVEKDENGWFSREGLCKAIKSVMDEDSEVGVLVRKNHAKWKGTLQGPGFMSGYVDRFIAELQELLDRN